MVAGISQTAWTLWVWAFYLREQCQADRSKGLYGRALLEPLAEIGYYQSTRHSRDFYRAPCAATVAIVKRALLR